MISQHTVSSNPGSRQKKLTVGRGDGSGHGSYSGRGMKGQLARSGGRRRPGFEGGQTPLIRRLPKLKGFKNPNRMAFQTVNVSWLEKFEDGTKVDIVMLYEHDLISHKNRPIKLLGDGEIKKKLHIKVDACSASARAKIEKAGGTVDVPKAQAVEGDTAAQVEAEAKKE